MDMDDELRRAGDALDVASRRHRPSATPPRGRTPWVAVAAGVLVVAAVVGALYIGRGGDDATSTTPGTGSVSDTTSETMAVITTPETDPSTTRGPAVLETTTVLPTDTTARSIQAIVHDDFNYYGACGNEVVDVFGTVFYPLLPEQVAALDLTIYPVFSPARKSSGLVRPQVGPPGPGDDIGTMTVYSDGVARFESQSGVVIWLSDVEQPYNWVC